MTKTAVKEKVEVQTFSSIEDLLKPSNLPALNADSQGLSEAERNEIAQQALELAQQLDNGRNRDIARQITSIGQSALENVIKHSALLQEQSSVLVDKLAVEEGKPDSLVEFRQMVAEVNPHNYIKEQKVIQFLSKIPVIGSLFSKMLTNSVKAAMKAKAKYETISQSLQGVTTDLRSQADDIDRASMELEKLGDYIITDQAAIKSEAYKLELMLAVLEEIDREAAPEDKKRLESLLNLVARQADNLRTQALDNITNINIIEGTIEQNTMYQMNIADTIRVCLNQLATAFSVQVFNAKLRQGQAAVDATRSFTDNMRMQSADEFVENQKAVSKSFEAPVSSFESQAEAVAKVMEGLDLASASKRKGYETAKVMIAQRKEMTEKMESRLSVYKETK
jgi:uncharacterized protein YaaN involved in tellurite resistance